jgi:hypothetical protein
MDYRQFVVEAFEREPGKWRARIQRASGKPVKVVGRKKLDQFVTGLNARTAEAALMMALAVIDAGSLSRGKVSTERIWRRRTRSLNAIAFGDRSDRVMRWGPQGRPA